jgi:hypothetical protein
MLMAATTIGNKVVIIAIVARSLAKPLPRKQRCYSV